jgi:hypothetical protein
MALKRPNSGLGSTNNGLAATNNELKVIKNSLKANNVFRNIFVKFNSNCIIEIQMGAETYIYARLEVTDTAPAGWRLIIMSDAVGIPRLGKWGWPRIIDLPPYTLPFSTLGRCVRDC